jgi:DNA-binding NtrC family response regulator
MKQRILLIDDDKAVRETICDMLEESGFTVFQASHGAEGMKWLAANQAELVITDVLMPEMEGIETIKEIRTLNPDAKIIAISGGGATGNMTYLEIAQKLGANMTLSKPIALRQLLNAVAQLIGKSSAQQGSAAASRGTPVVQRKHR